jgi:hypothetical protein
VARTEIVKQTVDADGVTITLGAVDATAAPDGNYVLTDGSELVLIQNDGASPITMTVDVPVEVDGVPVADRVVTVAAGALVAWKPKTVHRQSSGQVHLNWSTATEVTAAVIDV